MSGDAVLVVGGAGYIGSHMVCELLESGRKVVVLDDLSKGHRSPIHDATVFFEGCLSDSQLVRKIIRDHRVSTVMHFAAFIEVGESVIDPSRYFQNNVAKTLQLLDAMRAEGCSRFVFSSTAAVFGEPEYVPIDESHPRKPINPYGSSKSMVEQVLADYDGAYGLRSVCLRYFNAAGAHPDGGIGERHDPETHLIPLVLQVASGRRESIKIFGDDYDTPDGSCVRDYVHVCDLAKAHSAALSYLESGGASARFNLGNGEGYSVKQLIETSRRVTGRAIPAVVDSRRAGDPAVLVADSKKARSVLEWEPQYSSLEAIVEHAWNWELAHFGGAR